MSYFSRAVNCSCSIRPKIIHIPIPTIDADFNICNWPIVPSWMLAVLLGVWFSFKFHNLKQHVWAYSVTYLMYALMITSGLVVHSLFLEECDAERRSNYYEFVGLIDVSLTSCIALSFLFDGLIDLKVLRESSCVTLTAMLSSYGLIFYAYFSFNNWKKRTHLYFFSIVIGCSFYVLTQAYLIVTNHKKPHLLGLLCFLGAGLVGGTSLLLTRYYYCWLCQTVGPWSIEGVWYYGSDVSMFLLGIYIWKTLSSSSNDPGKH